MHDQYHVHNHVHAHSELNPPYKKIAIAKIKELAVGGSRRARCPGFWRPAERSVVWTQGYRCPPARTANENNPRLYPLHGHEHPPRAHTPFLFGVAALSFFTYVAVEAFRKRTSTLACLRFQGGKFKLSTWGRREV